MSEGTRALRGWALGSPIPITMRRDMDPEGLMCPCRYSTPYLHSLTMDFFHWPGPLLHNETVAEFVSSDDPDLRWQFGFGKEKKPARLMRWRSNLPWGGGGGFYTYNPSHIERMGQWDECDVIGVVRLFGEIAVHERGYRAQGVKIERLWVLWEASIRFKKEKIKDFLSSTYDCEVTILQKRLYDGFAQWVKKENIQNLSEL